MSDGENKAAPPQPAQPTALSDEAAKQVLKEMTAEADKARRDRFHKRLRATAPAPHYEAIPEGDGTIRLDMKCELEAVAEACGTVNAAFAKNLVSELLWAISHTSKPCEQTVGNAAVAAMAGIAPGDEAEGMLAAQMVATHQAAMKMLGRAVRANDLASAQWQSGFAIKLMRTYAAQMETLQRYRGKGQQKMTVEHIHVHAGGKAIVGNVAPTGGGGVQQKTEDQPHAKKIDYQPPVYAPMPAMPCADAEKEPVPVARNV